MSDQARHEWVDRLCGRLERILWGEGAADPHLTGDWVHPLPVWDWRPPVIDIGRKARRRDGRTMLMPVRIDWTPTLLLPARDDDTLVTLHWAVSGLGHTGAGTVTVQHTGARSPLRVVDGQWPTSAPPTAPTPVGGLRQDAHTARWEALMSLEGWVEMAVERAVKVVSADLADGVPVLDRTGREQVRDRLLLGVDGTSRVQRLLTRCTQPDVFAHCDPVRYVTVDLGRAAVEVVRQSVDDPRIGPAVRRLRADMPDASLPELLAEFRVRHPQADLAMWRAWRSLSAGHDASAVAVPLDMVGVA